MGSLRILDIGISNQNADWIKTVENRRTEEEIHDRLAEEIIKEEEGE